MKPIAIPPEVLKKVREMNPSDYLKSTGYEIKEEGRHLSAKMNGEEVYRLTQKNEGHWLFNPKEGGKGGDNIELVYQVEGLKFKDAVAKLSGENFSLGQTQNQSRSYQPKQTNFPSLPKQTHDDGINGRKYLEDIRKISLATIRDAENQKFIRYTSDGVLFVGSDEKGTVRNITKRMTKDPSPEILWVIEKGSDKSPFDQALKEKNNNLSSSKTYKDSESIHSAIDSENLKGIKTIITSKSIGTDDAGKIESVWVIKGNNQKDFMEFFSKTNDLKTEVITDLKQIHEKITSHEFQSKIKDANSLIVSGPSSKKDIAGTDKLYPQILAGSPKSIWIVEGGVDALALHDMAKRNEKNPPTVIVSSGSKVLSFLDNPLIQEKLKAAENIVIAKEQEKNEKVQSITDKDHIKQAEKIEKITGRKIVFYKPPEGIKDLAKYNELQVNHLRSLENEKKTPEMELSR